MPEPHIWKGREIATIGDLVDALVALEDADEAQEFITGYREVNEHADANAGYCTGYLDPVRAEELRGWMNTAHPVFGMKSPSAAEALAAGARRAGGDHA